MADIAFDGICFAHHITDHIFGIKLAVCAGLIGFDTDGSVFIWADLTVCKDRIVVSTNLAVLLTCDGGIC